MRVFVGIQLSKELQEKIGEWQEKYKNIYPPEGIRWTDKKNLHVTLLPPWEEKNVEELIKKLQEKPLPLSSFTLVFTTILFMPPRKSKYIWARGETPESLLKLRDNIAKLVGREVEKRPFTVHATIARLNKDAQVTPVIDEIDSHMLVDSFALFQSQRLSVGADYKVLATFPL